MTTLKDIGELAAIARIVRRLPSHRDILLGAGDDCAVVRGPANSGQDWVLTSDPVIEGTHFTPGTPPRLIGRKALGRVLSDLAAMGAAPNWCLVDIAAPSTTQVSTLDEAYDGALAIAEEHAMVIVGGDLSEGPVFELHVFGLGSVPAGQAIRRSGASPGDLLFVTGVLGGSLRGSHLDFMPRVAEGRWLRDWATAMIDVSDGLASDLRHLAGQSGTGCDLNTAQIPISTAAQEMNDDLSALDHALHDGEDFELLFTVPAQDEGRFVAAWQNRFKLACTRIGVMTAEKDLVRCIDHDGSAHPLEDVGHTHF